MNGSFAFRRTAAKPDEPDLDGRIRRSTNRDASHISTDGSSLQPTISVIVPHYNDLEQLRVCYARLLCQTWPSVDFEIVVADNNSICGLDAVREALPRAIVVPAPVQGAGPARNAGVAASSGRVLAFIDSDCVPEPEWLHEGVAALAHFDFVGGQVVTFARDTLRPTPVEAYEIVFNFDFQRYIEKVGFTGTGNMFVSRELAERVGEFRTGVAEDMDWSFRACALGLKLGYAPRAIVGHPARRNWVELERRWCRLVDQQFEMALEQKLGRTNFALKGLIMPLSVVPHAAKVLASPRLKTMPARLGAIAVLLRLRFWRAWRMLRTTMIYRTVP
jgi:glycosyltransferase involved in cell wall biosynthesis